MDKQSQLVQHLPQTVQLDNKKRQRPSLSQSQHQPPADHQHKVRASFDNMLNTIDEKWRGSALEVARAWEDRHDIFRRASSVSHQSTQRRVILMFGVHSVRERLTLFAEWQKRFPWSAATAASYWEAAWSAGKTIDLPPPTFLEVTFGKLLRREAQKEFLRHPTGVTPAEASEIVAALKKSAPTTAAAMQLTYGLAQRFADVMLLRAEEIRLIGPWVAITFLEGKVTARIGPWTMHIPRESKMAEALLALAHNAKTGRIFPHDQCTRELRSELRPRGFKQTCLRRGAVQAMAATALDQDVIDVTQHKSRRTFNIYTQRGLFSLGQAKARMETLKLTGMWPCCMPK